MKEVKYTDLALIHEYGEYESFIVMYMPNGPDFDLDTFPWEEQNMEFLAKWHDYDPRIQAMNIYLISIIGYPLITNEEIMELANAFWETTVNIVPPSETGE